MNCNKIFIKYFAANVGWFLHNALIVFSGSLIRVTLTRLRRFFNCFFQTLSCFISLKKSFSKSDLAVFSLFCIEINILFLTKVIRLNSNTRCTFVTFKPNSIYCFRFFVIKNITLFLTFKLGINFLTPSTFILKLSL